MQEVYGDELCADYINYFKKKGYKYACGTDSNMLSWFLYNLYFVLSVAVTGTLVRGWFYILRYSSRVKK